MHDPVCLPVIPPKCYSSFTYRLPSWRRKAFEVILCVLYGQQTVLYILEERHATVLSKTLPNPLPNAKISFAKQYGNFAFQLHRSRT